MLERNIVRHIARRPTNAGRMAGRLQLAQTTFSFEQPDAHGILAEKGDGQDGCLTPKI